MIKQWRLVMKNEIDKTPSFGGIIGRTFKDYSLLNYAISAFKCGCSTSNSHFT